MKPVAKKPKLDDISNVPTISLVWLDDSIEDSEETIAVQQQLRTFDSNLKIFKDDNECEEYIQSQSSHSLIILIVNGKFGQKIVPRVHEFSQIISIYVFCWDKQLYEAWAKDFTKVKSVVTESNDLKEKIQIDHFNDKTQQRAGIFEIDNRYIISDVCIDYLSRMKSNPKDKDEFISLCYTALGEHPQRVAVLQEFQESYSSDRALSWFSRDPFFYQILDNIFQTANTTMMYLCRFFIRDIQNQFENHKYTSTIQVYYSQLMPDEHYQELKNSEGKIIAFKSFLSTTLNRDIAIAFISDQNEQKRVLFDIEANPQLEGVKPFIKTNPDLTDEHEVLFMFGSLFKVNEIRDDENGITIIKMTLCANETDNPMKSRLNDINEEEDLIGFVQLQCDMCCYLSYSIVLDNIDKLLEKYLDEITDDHPDRIRCYDTLGNVSFAKNDFDSSLHWYRKSLEMKKKILSSYHPKLADCYNNIAFVYLHKRDNTQALDAFKQVLTIWKQVYGDDYHPNLIYCYTQMIGIYELEGEFTEVVSCYMQIFSIMLKQYPIDDINFAPIYNNIGKTFVSLYQYPLALGYYETSLNIKLKNLPSPSESTALSHKSVGIVYKNMGNVDQARIHFEKAADIYRQLYSARYEIVLEIEQLIQNMLSSSQ